MGTALNAHEWGLFVEDEDAFSVKQRPGANTIDRHVIILARTRKDWPFLVTFSKSHWDQIMQVWSELDEHYGRSV